MLSLQKNDNECLLSKYTRTKNSVEKSRKYARFHHLSRYYFYMTLCT